MINLPDGFYLVDQGVAFQWYATREEAERALTKYASPGWKIRPAAEINQKVRSH